MGNLSRLFLIMLILMVTCFAVTSDIKGFSVKRDGKELPSGACVKGGEVLTVSNSGLDVKDKPGAGISTWYLGCVAQYGLECLDCGGVKLTSTTNWAGTLSWTSQSCGGKSCYLKRKDNFMVPSGESYYGKNFKIGLYAGAVYKQLMWPTPLVFCANKDTKTRTFLIGECSSDSDCPNGFCGSDCMCHSLEEEGWTHPNHNSYGDSNMRRESSWGQVTGFSEDNPFDSKNVNKLWEVDLSGSPLGDTADASAPIVFVDPNSNKRLVAVYSGYSGTASSVTRQSFIDVFSFQPRCLVTAEYSVRHTITIIDGDTGEVYNTISFTPYYDRASKTYTGSCTSSMQPPDPSEDFENNKEKPALKYIAFVPASDANELVYLYKQVNFSRAKDDPKRSWNQLVLVTKPWSEDNMASESIRNIDQTTCVDTKDHNLLSVQDANNTILSAVSIEHGLSGALFITYLEKQSNGQLKVRGARVHDGGQGTLTIFPAAGGCQRKSYDADPDSLTETVPVAGRLADVTGYPASVDMGGYSTLKEDGSPVTYVAAWVGEKALAEVEGDVEAFRASCPYFSTGTPEDDFVYDLVGYVRQFDDTSTYDQFYISRVHVRSDKNIIDNKVVNVSDDVESLGAYTLPDSYYSKLHSFAKFSLKDYPDHYFLVAVKDSSKLMIISVPRAGGCDSSKDSLCDYSVCDSQACKWEFSVPRVYTNLATADLDGDGNEEILYGGTDEKVYIYKWRPPGASDVGLTNLGSSKALSGAVTRLSVDDVDRDGFLDLIVSLATGDGKGKLVALSWLPSCKVNFTVTNMVCAEDGQTAQYSFNVAFPRAGMQGNATVYHTYWTNKKDYTYYPDLVGPGTYSYSHTFDKNAGDIDLSEREGMVTWNAVNVTPVYHGVKLAGSSCFDRDLLYALGGNIFPDLPAGKARTGEVSFTIAQNGSIRNTPKEGTNVSADVLFIADDVNEYKHCKVSDAYDGFGPGSEIALDMNGDGIYESWKFESDKGGGGAWTDSCVDLEDTGWRACESTSYSKGEALSEGWIVLIAPNNEYALRYVLGGSCGTSTDQKLLEPGKHSEVFKARYDEPGQTFTPQAWFMFRDLNDTRWDDPSVHVFRSGPKCIAETTFSTLEAPNCTVEVTPPDYACYGQPAEFQVRFTDSTSSPGEVTLNFGGGNQKTVTVNNKDTVIVSNQYSSKGNYSIRADARGKESGSRCSANTTFEVYDKREDVEPFVQPTVTCNQNKQELTLYCTDQKGAPVPGNTVKSWSVIVNGDNVAGDYCYDNVCHIPLADLEAQDFVYTASCTVRGTECYVYTKTTASTSGDFNCSFAKPVEGEGVIAYNVSCTQQGSPVQCTVTHSGEVKNGHQSVESVNCPGLKVNEPVTCTIGLYNDYGESKTAEVELSSTDFTVTQLVKQSAPGASSEGSSTFSFTPGEYGRTGKINAVVTVDGFPEDHFTLTAGVEPEPGKCSEDCRYCTTQTACSTNSNCEWKNNACEYKQVGGLPEYPELVLFALAGLFALVLLRRSK